MSAPGDIFIGAVKLSPFGRTYTEKNIRGEREERTVNGTLRTDILWTKKQFTLAYSEIAGTALAQYEAIYATGGDLTMVIWHAGSGSSTYTVRMRPFDKTRLILRGDGLWSGVTFEFDQV